jgi:macrolide transport system ATP-binding/permease protein
MIVLKNICKTYHTGDTGVQALRDVTLTIRQGEFVAIMGPSGSGKSTMLHLLGLLDRPDSGSYALAGQEVSRLPDNTLAYLRNHLLGFVFQQFHLLPRMNALGNVRLPLIYAGQSFNRHTAMEKIRSVGLEDRASHRPNELSGGQQQRVSVARALVNDPAVILADEPTGNLDSKNGREIIDLLKKLNRECKTVILVTHDPDIACHVGRVITMKDGQIISDQATGSPAPETAGQAQQASCAMPAVDLKPGSRLHFLNYFRQAFGAILSNKMRSFLSMLGILIGVAAVIAMLALGEGARASISRSLSSLGSNLLVVRPGNPRMHGVSLEAGSVTRFTMKDAEEMALLPQVRDMYPEVRGRAQVVYLDKNTNTSVQGTGASYAAMRASKPSLGRFFTEQENRGRQKVVVLGTTVSKALFGDRNPVGETVKINRIYFKVIGVFPRKGGMGPHDQDDMIVVPIMTAMYRLLGKDYVDSISAEVRDPGLMEDAKSAITELIRKRHRLKSDDESFNVRDMTEIQEVFKSTTTTMTVLLGSIAAISLLVGGIGIMNIMLVSVSERTREIGLRKAIGARNSDILWQFLVEAIVLTLSGGLLGILFGTGASRAISTLAGWSVIVTPFSVLLSTAFSVIIGVSFGIWPARRAAGLDPIEALRYE